MNIVEARKYFDYKLAYDGYEKIKELFDKGGIQAVIDDFDFDVSEGCTLEEWKKENCIPIYACGYNATYYIINKNYNNDKEEEWVVSNEVDIVSYHGGDTTICIDNINNIEFEIINLINYARENAYLWSDLYAEYDGLMSIRDKLKELNKNEK